MAAVVLAAAHSTLSFQNSEELMTNNSPPAGKQNNGDRGVLPSLQEGREPIDATKTRSSVSKPAQH